MFMTNTYRHSYIHHDSVIYHYCRILNEYASEGNKLERNGQDL